MAVSSLAGLALEALQWQPYGINLAVVLHGLYCLLAGYLVIQSRFLPRISGLLIAFAGLVWLLYLSPQLSDRIAPYNTAAGLLGEVSLMLWLLIAGVNLQRWNEQAGRSSGENHAGSPSSESALAHNQGQAS